MFVCTLGNVLRVTSTALIGFLRVYVSGRHVPSKSVLNKKVIVIKRWA